MKEKITVLAFFALLGVLFACARDKGDIRTWTVASETRSCVGVGPQTCLLIKEEEDPDWTYFYDRIDGFDYEKGYEYIVKVRVSDVENPPMDASSKSYSLVKIVDKQKKNSENLPVERLQEVDLPSRVPPTECR